MKTLKFYSTILMVVFVLTLLPIYSFAETAPSTDATKHTASQAFDQKTTDTIIKKIRDIKVKPDPKGSSVTTIPDGSVSVSASTQPWDYPTRKGVILVTHDKYSGLIPTGHAAIIHTSYEVVESLSDGVVMGANNWWKSKTSSAASTVKSTSGSQDCTAADWCKKQLGKPYNYNFFDTSTRGCFYCSELVYASFKDNFGINLNTGAYSTPFGNPIHPTELIDNSLVTVIYRLNW